MLQFFILTLLYFISPSISCGEYAHLFTEEEYNIIASKPIRKEIRTLSKEEWNDVVDAIWTMKNIITEDGRDIYGAEYESWDRLLCRHMTATSDPNGDQGHSAPVFIIFHRALLMQYERMLKLIKPNINIGFPYWNWEFDAYKVDNSIIFSNEYFGSRKGDPDNKHIVTDGKFAYFPVRINDDFEDTNCAVHNAYGFMRSPLVPIKNPYVTRFGGSTCDEFSPDLGDPTFFETCYEEPGNIVEWFSCIDTSIHGNIHTAVGGTHRLYPDITPISNCFEWEDAGRHYDNLALNAFVKDFDCFEYKTCSIDEPITDCQAYPKNCVMYGEEITLLERSKTSYVGDFWDVTGSPNDPIFPFHHINMDRHLMKWQLKNYNLKNEYYGFPTTDYGPGGKLDDVMNFRDPFQNIFTKNDELRDVPLTVRDIFDNTDFIDLPYVYDEILSLIDRTDCNFDVNNQEIQLQSDYKKNIRFTPFMLL